MESDLNTQVIDMSYEYKGSSTPTEQSSLAGGIIDEDEEILEQPTKAELKRRYRNLSMILVGIIAVAVVLLLVQCNSGPPEQLEWSEWMEVLPDYATEEFYKIEEQTLYRSRNLETTSSTTQSELAGWELYDTIEGNGEFGGWSEWSASEVIGNENREVETQTRYHYCDKETTSSSESTMSGWELADTTYTWGEYGGWSGWSASAVSDSESRKVDTKTQYSYRDLQYTTSTSSSLSGWTHYDTTVDYGSWSGWTTTPISGSSTLEVETYDEYQYTRYYMAHYCTGNVPGAQYLTCATNNSSNATFNANCVYHSLGWYDSLSSFSQGNGGYTGAKCSNTCWTWYIMGTEDVYTTYYRSRPISYTYHFMKYGSWSDWSDTAYSSSSNREVQTRTLYRYCDREQIPTYHFWRWGDWTDWSVDAVSATDNRQVETTLYYRYRDRQLVTTYYFQRWGDWSGYSKAPVTASDTTEVETLKQYRFKSKDN